MTYEELKELGFSDEAIRAQGILPPNKKAKGRYTIQQCADAWKIVKCRLDRKGELSTEEHNTFVDMCLFYEEVMEYKLPEIKGFKYETI
jgi:hypothetical protein